MAVSVRLPVGLVGLWRVRADGLGVSRTAFLEGALRVALGEEECSSGAGSSVVSSRSAVVAGGGVPVGVGRAEAFRAATSRGSR